MVDLSSLSSNAPILAVVVGIAITAAVAYSAIQLKKIFGILEKILKFQVHIRSEDQKTGMEQMMIPGRGMSPKSSKQIQRTGLGDQRRKKALEELTEIQKKEQKLEEERKEIERKRKQLQDQLNATSA